MNMNHFQFLVIYHLIYKEKTEKGLGAYYLDKAEKLLKRIIDIGGSVAGIILFLPVFLYSLAGASICFHCRFRFHPGYMPSCL